MTVEAPLRNPSLSLKGQSSCRRPTSEFALNFAPGVFGVAKGSTERYKTSHAVSYQFIGRSDRLVAARFAANLTNSRNVRTARSLNSEAAIGTRVFSWLALYLATYLIASTGTSSRA